LKKEEGSGKQEAGSRKQEAGSRKQEEGRRKQEDLFSIRNAQFDIILSPVALELTLPEIRTRQCRVPIINQGRETARAVSSVSFWHSRN